MMLENGLNHDKIIDYLFFKNDKYNKSRAMKFYKNISRYNNICQYLTLRFNDSESIRETIYRIHFNIYEHPKCPITGNPLKFLGRKNKLFSKHYSLSASASDKTTQDKARKTGEERYGVHNSKNNTKASETCIKKYGVSNPFQLDSVRSIKRNINLPKRKETCIKRYGCQHYFQSEEFKEKYKVTSLEKYNESHPMKNNSVHQKIETSDIIHKIQDTKRKNGTYNTSIDEEICYTLLCDKYGADSVKRQYMSDAYPFRCDFYIKTLDLYIEYNGSWTHGGKPYTGSDEDNAKIQLWKNKNTRYYNNAIKTWTIRDVNKRETAKRNKLNYFEFWALDEIYEFLNDRQ